MATVAWEDTGTEHIATDLSERILTITLNRPERLNAWTPTMARELIEAFDRADADDEVGAIIVTGAGRGFCAGADLGAGGETFDWRKRGAEQDQPEDNGGQFTLRVFNSLKPVIAAINGPAVGVGATMTLPMDVRLAAEDARMGFVERIQKGVILTREQIVAKVVRGVAPHRLADRVEFAVDLVVVHGAASRGLMQPRQRAREIGDAGECEGIKGDSGHVVLASSVRP